MCDVGVCDVGCIMLDVWWKVWRVFVLSVWCWMCVERVWLVLWVLLSVRCWVCDVEYVMKVLCVYLPGLLLGPQSPEVSQGCATVTHSQAWAGSTSNRLVLDLEHAGRHLARTLSPTMETNYFVYVLFVCALKSLMLVYFETFFGGDDFEEKCNPWISQHSSSLLFIRCTLELEMLKLKQ